MMSNLKKYVDILESICEDNEPGKKTVQKLTYLIERKGVKLDFEYTIHFFGPYSSKLDNVLHLLQCDEAININTGGITHTISIKDTSHYDGEQLSQEDKEKVSFIIDNFKDKSALELEGITTLDFVANSLKPEDRAEDNLIIEKVKHIKGTKFSEEQLREYLDTLKQYEFLS